mgnify:CR=1 FL=1
MTDRPDCGCAADAHEGHSFYVTAHDGVRYAFLLGPYLTHCEALAQVEQGRGQAVEANPWAHFYSFGTASLPAGSPPPRRVVFGGPHA